MDYLKANFIKQDGVSLEDYENKINNFFKNSKLINLRELPKLDNQIGKIEMVFSMNETTEKKDFKYFDTLYKHIAEGIGLGGVITHQGFSEKPFKEELFVKYTKKFNELSDGGKLSFEEILKALKSEFKNITKTQLMNLFLISEISYNYFDMYNFSEEVLFNMTEKEVNEFIENIASKSNDFKKTIKVYEEKFKSLENINKNSKSNKQVF